MKFLLSFPFNQTDHDSNSECDLDDKRGENSPKPDTKPGRQVSPPTSPSTSRDVVACLVNHSRGVIHGVPADSDEEMSDKKSIDSICQKPRRIPRENIVHNLT